MLLRYEWSRKYKYPILLSLGAITLALSFVDLRTIGIVWDTYYMPHLRVPEMLVGALLAMAWSDGLLRKFEDKLASRLSLLCLAVLFVCFFLTGVFVPPFFPGLASLIPCIAAAGLLYLNAQPTSRSRLLSNAFVVWIGKISYSLHLWHWVVLAWFRYVYGVGPLEPQQLVVASLLMLFLSVLSYYFVEQPTRHLKLSFGQGLMCFYLAPAGLMLALYLLPEGLYGKTYLPKEYSTMTPTHGMLFDTVEGAGLVGDTSKPATVLIAGDSHAAHLDAFWDYVSKREGWCAYASAASSNPFFFDYVFHFRGDTEEFADKRNKFLSKHYGKYDTVILSVYWGSKYYAKDPEFIPAMDKALNRLLQEGKRVYLVNSLYEVADTRLKEYWLERYGIELPTRDYLGAINDSSRAYAERIREHVQKYFPQVVWVDLEPYLPKSMMINGKPVLADNNHWNSYEAELVAIRFVSEKKLLP